MDNFTPSKNDSVYETSTIGSKVESVYGTRKMKVYGVFEEELDTVTFMNTISTGSFSIAAFFLQNIISNITITWGSLTNPSVDATLIFIAVGIYSVFKSKSTLKKIKDGHRES